MLNVILPFTSGLGKWLNFMIKPAYLKALFELAMGLCSVTCWEWWRKPLGVGSFYADPQQCPPPVFTTLKNPLLCVRAGPSDSILMKRRQPLWWDVTSMSRFKRLCLLSCWHSPSCPLSVWAWMKRAATLERSMWQGPEGRLWPTTSEEWGPSGQPPVRNWVLQTTTEWTWKPMRPQLPAVQAHPLTEVPWEALKDRQIPI